MLTAAFARHLDARGLVVFGRDGTDAFLEQMPADPAAAVGLYARAGAGGLNAGHPYDMPGLQVLVRAAATAGSHARAGYERAVAIRDALHGLALTTIAAGTPDELWVVQVVATSSVPVNIGDDAHDRPRWSIPFDVEVAHPTTLRPLP